MFLCFEVYRISSLLNIVEYFCLEWPCLSVCWLAKVLLNATALNHCTVSDESWKKVLSVGSSVTAYLYLYQLCMRVHDRLCIFICVHYDMHYIPITMIIITFIICLSITKPFCYLRQSTSATFLALLLLLLLLLFLWKTWFHMKIGLYILCKLGCQHFTLTVHSHLNWLYM